MSLYSDLDELVLKCKNEKSKKYIYEAISCYRNGAYRASIITTWISIVFDLIEKFHELSLCGDNKATQLSSEFKMITAQGDISKSLNYEREILDKAKNELDMFSSLELLELKRIQDDRNKSAHPSMLNDDMIFNPIPELVRTHIVNAINIVLGQSPSQGRYAFNKIINDIDSMYFPSNINDIEIVLKSSPIYNARKNLYDNIITVILKNIIRDKNDDELYLKKLKGVLTVLKGFNTNFYNEILNKRINNLIKSISDNLRISYFMALNYIPDIWVYLDESLRVLISKYLENDSFILSQSQFLGFRNVDESIKNIIDKRMINAVDDNRFVNIIIAYEGIVIEYIDKLINCYSLSSSYSAAIAMQNTVIKYIPCFTKQQIEKLISSHYGNRQCWENGYSESVIEAIIESTVDTRENIEQLIAEAEKNKK